MKTSILAISVVVASAISVSGHAADERLTFGWGGTGGGNLTMFSVNHDNPVARAGELAFIYGGSATAQGDITFLQYVGNNTWIERMSLDDQGVFRIGAGRSTSCGVGCKFAVNGTIATTEVKVAGVGSWPDYVFKPEYSLRSLDEVESFVKTNGHLPDMPSADNVEKSGLNLGEMNAKLLQKIEELTLYMIEMKNENERLSEEVSVLSQRLK